ncbi:MAG: Sua5/YciO/YrdC/YwlC family protein, partial [Planctomycetes bacterium]|nr:Sua5/YciO/YrdC/YwlC family protein [Planctomycetota bacterium]
SNPAAVERARELKGREASHPFTWHVADRGQLAALAAPPSARARKLIDRYWPGPLTLVLPARNGEGDVGVRQPAHEFTAAVIAALGEPLWLSSVNRTGEPPLLEADAICASFGGELALVVDDGPSPLGVASTVVRDRGDRLEVLREGILDSHDVLHTAADLTLFVCTGNTCRSPLAEALARDLAARTLGTAPADVLAHGFAFASAGTSTLDGMPASEGSIAAGSELGLDLTAHSSRLVTRELVEHATRIYCLSQSHRAALLAEFPAAGDKVQLLRQDQLDIQDPFGGPIEVYRKTRDEIRAAIGARLPEWLAG